MAVFGESYSKFQSRNISSGTVVDLNYSIIIPKWNTHNILEKQSVITRVRSYTEIRQDFADFDVIVNLWKNGDPQTAYETIITYNHDTVYFMPHEDSGQYLDDPNTGTPAEFYITKMAPFYLRGEKNVLQDKMLITFKSKVAIDPGSLILDDPGLIDPSNIILLLDGDLDLSNTVWKNQVGDLANMVMYPRAAVQPIYNPAGVNGHGTIAFDGYHTFEGQCGQILTPAMTIQTLKTTYTTYFVIKQNGFTGNRVLFDDGTPRTSGGGVHWTSQKATDYTYSVRDFGIQYSPKPTVGNWFILSAIIKDGPTAGSVRIYEENVGDSGRVQGRFGTSTSDIAGITIGASSYSQYQTSLSEFAYVLFRESEDSLATQDSIFDTLKNRFAI